MVNHNGQWYLAMIQGKMHVSEGKIESLDIKGNLEIVVWTIGDLGHMEVRFQPNRGWNLYSSAV